MNYYLVDFENVRTEGIKDLHGVHNGDAIVIFYSDNCKNITLDVLTSMATLNLTYKCFKVKLGTKNALDFQLTSFLGFLIGQESEESNYYIVSADKGFEVVADFWREQGVSVSCILFKEQTTSISSEEKVTNIQESKNKKSKVSSQDLATINEIKALIDNKNEPDAVLKIFNQYKTKQAIANGLSKYFKDSKKGGEIYKKLKPLLKAKNKS